MQKIDPVNPPKPCDYFDLIGGTSTGGLIAIMLGRLKMSIEECRDAYLELSKQAFTPVTWFPLVVNSVLPSSWSIRPRFDSKALELGIKNLVVQVLRRDPQHKDKSEAELVNTLLRDPDSKCKV